MSKQSGFTLIELVVVMVILGILGAVALPKFVDLSDTAGQSVAEGVASALSSASATNFSACKVGDNGCVNDAVPGTLNACDDFAALLVTALPTKITLATTALSTVSGATTPCTVSYDALGINKTATFTAITP